MAYQRVPETAEITVNFTVNAIPQQNTFYARKSGGYSTADLAALAGAVDAAVGTYWLDDMTTAALYVKTVVRGLDLEFDQIVEDVGSTGPGTQPTSEQPANVSFAIKKLSGLTGRSARGRIYVIGMYESAFGADTNYVTSAYAAQWAGNVDQIRVAINTIGWTPVLVSRYSGGTKRPEGITFVWTGSTYTDLRVDSRRDRLPG